jgi:hypothetical protein
MKNLYGLAVAALVGAPLCTGIAQAKVPVVKGAQAISVSEKAGVNGECGCTPTPTPSSSETAKPGYGFGAPTQHYGPPGQGFNQYYSWRDQIQVSDYTPKGNPLPPRAFVVK